MVDVSLMISRILCLVVAGLRVLDDARRPSDGSRGAAGL